MTRDRRQRTARGRRRPVRDRADPWTIRSTRPTVRRWSTPPASSPSAGPSCLRGTQRAQLRPRPDTRRQRRLAAMTRRCVCGRVSPTRRDPDRRQSSEALRGEPADNSPHTRGRDAGAVRQTTSTSRPLHATLSTSAAIHYVATRSGAGAPSAPYATFGSTELAAGGAAAREGRSAALMATTARSSPRRASTAPSSRPPPGGGGRRSNGTPRLRLATISKRSAEAVRRAERTCARLHRGRA